MRSFLEICLPNPLQLGPSFLIEIDHRLPLEDKKFLFYCSGVFRLIKQPFKVFRSFIRVEVVVLTPLRSFTEPGMLSRANILK